jgi:AraC-like DNA-binding protein
MAEQATKNQTKFWTAPDLKGLQLLSASYVRHSFPRHFHDTYLINVQKLGTKEFYCKGEFYNAPAGSIIAVNPGEIHTGNAYGEEPWVYRAIYPGPDLMLEVVSALGGSLKSHPYFPNPILFDTRLARSLSRLHRILESSQDTLERQSSFITTMSQLIVRHAKNQSDIKAAGSESRAVKMTRDYIVAHYKDNPTLTELAGLTGLNSFYLIRSFRKVMGLPPHEFLNQVRVMRAMELLASGVPIIQVALETGFADQSHLNKRFKRFVGITPKQFALGLATVQRQFPPCRNPAQNVRFAHTS